MTFQDVHTRYDDVHTAFIDVRTVLGDVRWVLLPEKYCSHKASVARNCPSASYSNSGPRGGIVIYTARARMLRQQTEDYLDLNILCCLCSFKGTLLTGNFEVLNQSRQ